MSKYNEKITDSSVWLTATPSPAAMTLPFYITEAGHFRAEAEYSVEREGLDSYLLLYTIGGCGNIITGDNSLMLEKNCAAVIDCRRYHKYHSASDEWEFFWIHFNGSGAPSFFELLYPVKETAITLSDTAAAQSSLSFVISNIMRRDIASAVALSSAMHTLFDLLIRSAMSTERQNRKNVYDSVVNDAAEFIKAHYGEAITVDDIIGELHISKYHFIRLFSRVMGVTPYSYLTAYRINMAKILLRTTDKPVSEIAEQCGFSDTSNFINHFKKRAGQRPARYRRDFS